MTIHERAARGVDRGVTTESGPQSYIRELAPQAQPAFLPGATQIVHALLEAGVDTFFGVPGGPISPLFDAVLQTPGARLIESRHETHAAFAAAGYHRATGAVAAVVVTAGPGATNAVTGVTSAHVENVPMLVICGDVAWAANGGRLAQDTGPEGIAAEEMFARITRATVRVAQPQSAAAHALAALQAARDPRRPGPALLVLPIDRGAQAAPALRVAHARLELATLIDPSAIADTARSLAEAERPLVVLGAGARPHVAALQRLMDLLNVPFVTTPAAKGLLSELHPRSLRNAGLAASWWARRYTAAGVDVCLALGTDLDDSSVGATPPIRAGGALIHVDTNPAVFNRNYPTTLAVAADLGAFADQLYDEVASTGVRNARGSALVRELRAASAFDAPDFATDDRTRIAPHRAIADLEAAAGESATFVTDIGEHMLFALHYLTARGPDRFAVHLGLGSMGSGICSAVGLALGDRARRVVCICGDGGMQMAGSELLVALKERLPIVYAVFNDARYNMVYHGYKQVYGREARWTSPWIDFVAWARAMGIPGARINGPGEITAELLDALTATGMPAVLDIRIDADVRIKGAGRNEALRHMSMTTGGVNAVTAVKSEA